MAIPKINLIPPAYYLRKKVKAAVAAAVTLIALEVIGLVVLAMMQNQKREDLTQQQTEAQAKADAVAALKSNADKARASVADVAGKVGFVDKVFQANAQWPDAFEGVARYTYPKVQYTSIKTTPNSDTMVVHVKTLSQRDMNTYWSNLLRCPIVKVAYPSALLGYTSPDQNGNGGGLAGGPGGPLPGPTPGGPSPIPGGPTSLGTNPLQQAQTIANTLGSNGGLGPAGTPGAAFDASQIQLPPPPATYDFDMTVVLTNKITPATYGNAAANTGQ